MRNRDSTLRDHLAVLSRRKWIVLYSLGLVPLVALAISVRQQELFEAKAEVLLSRQNIANTLTGTPDPLSLQQPDRLVQTQANLAETPEVVERVLRAIPIPGMTTRRFLKMSKVTPQANTDLLVFSVRNSDPALVRRLAGEYARQFTGYRRELDTTSIVRARKGVAQRLDELAGEGDRQSALYASLVEKEEQLRTLEALQTSNAFVVRDGDSVERVQPKPLRNLLIGLVLGLVLGVGLAFLREALDTRLKSEDEITEPLGLPLLARIPSPPPELAATDGLVMLAEPHSHEAEAFRILRTNLEFMNATSGAKKIMVTSALEQEGKSTTVANLAVALAAAGKRVGLMDLDLRRPYVHRFFRVDYRLGITNIVGGQTQWADALASAQASPSIQTPPTPYGSASNGHHRGTVLVFPSGPLPHDPGEFVGHPRLRELIEAVSEQVDVLLVDAPPLLPVGDALVLGGAVDAVLIVARTNLLDRTVLAELSGRLERIPAAKLGYVLTGAETSAAYGRAYTYEPRQLAGVG